MPAFARARLGVVVAVFAAAYLCQPLALNACAVSCEAARAARTAAVAAPCHHTTSCATQVSQPTAPGSTVVAQALAPPPAIVAITSPLLSAVRYGIAAVATASGSPPLVTQLRL